MRFWWSVEVEVPCHLFRVFFYFSVQPLVVSLTDGFVSITFLLQFPWTITFPFSKIGRGSFLAVSISLIFIPVKVRLTPFRSCYFHLFSLVAAYFPLPGPLPSSSCATFVPVPFPSFSITRSFAESRCFSCFNSFGCIVLRLELVVEFFLSWRTPFQCAYVRFFSSWISSFHSASFMLSVKR